MKCTITIDMDNAAFEPDANFELGRILNELGDLFQMDSGARQFTSRDINGNIVGKAEVTE